jgi:hypothetical protein
MALNLEVFLKSIRKHLDNTRYYKVSAKTDNAIDTLRIFMATDYACAQQSDFFNPNGISYWRGNKYGEFLCDYTFHYNHKIVLALESEWGTANSPKQTIEKIIYDFRKVINMEASIKVMVFAYTNTNNENSIMSKMKEILNGSSFTTNSSLLIISCPWDDELRGETIKSYIWSEGLWVTI